MGYRDSGTLIRLIDIAADDIEIRTGLITSNLRVDEVRQEILQDCNETVWPNVSEKLAELSSIDAQLQAEEKGFWQLEKRRKKLRVRLVNVCLLFAVYLGLSAAEPAVITNIKGFKEIFSVIPDPLNKYLCIFFATGVVSTLLYDKLQRPQWAGNDELSRTRKAKEELLDKEIIERLIKERFRLKINEVLTRSYSPTFELSGAPGLAEMMDTTQAVDSNATKRLKFLFENMPNGTIGLAGPRGAGKTTLLSYYCGASASQRRIKRKNILPVHVSAPVCQSALKIDPPSASKIDPPQAVVFTSLPSF